MIICTCSKCGCAVIRDPDVYVPQGWALINGELHCDYCTRGNKQAEDYKKSEERKRRR